MNTPQTLNPLFAIFKNCEHKGNQRGINELDAIKQYIVDSGLGFFLNDDKFMAQYSASLAIEDIHYIKMKFGI